MNDILRLKAKHFEDTDFESITDCAIAKAAKEQFNTFDVNVSTTYICLDKAFFLKIKYNYAQFKEDKIIAELKNYSEEVLREIKILRA